jgi:hypothetical protein
MSQSSAKLSDLLLSVNSPEGRERVAQYLKSLPFPHYQAHPGKSGLLDRIEQDGTHTMGRFLGREFEIFCEPGK